MKRKPTASRLKKKLDATFSLYIRTKFSKDGLVSCYTCPRRAPIKEMQNGHFVPRQYLKTRWDERNCRPQCYACNILYNGQPSRFAERLIAEYGPDIIQELERDRMIPAKLDIQWYETEVKRYQDKLSTYDLP